MKKGVGHDISFARTSNHLKGKIVCGSFEMNFAIHVQQFVIGRLEFTPGAGNELIVGIK